MNVNFRLNYSDFLKIHQLDNNIDITDIGMISKVYLKKNNNTLKLIIRSNY